MMDSDRLELRQLLQEIDDLDRETQARISLMRRRVQQILRGGSKPVSRIVEFEDRLGKKVRYVSGVDLD